ncbi:hypothetical protein GH714_014728 [Hevea brasiliensis]|uniref:Uncharacterized protein n=1 Tax=Hevea brasiliensis TaxID=3981 RepID=A0A6A6MEC5_HEVBR|nr:hypothetical protein GH714_014728 [Hevea brasiliensis]
MASVWRPMKGGPWNYQQQPILLHELQPNEKPREVELTRLDLWVQVHDVPNGFMFEHVAKDVGTYIGIFWNLIQGIFQDYGVTICIYGHDGENQGHRDPPIQNLNCERVQDGSLVGIDEVHGKANNGKEIISDVNDEAIITTDIKRRRMEEALIDRAFMMSESRILLKLIQKMWKWRVLDPRPAKANEYHKLELSWA